MISSCFQRFQVAKGTLPIRTSLNFSTTYGTWNPVSWAGPCSFSLDGANFLGSDGGNLYVFDPALHTIKRTIPLGSAGVLKARFSRGGNIAYGLVQFSGDSFATVKWAQYP